MIIRSVVPAFESGLSDCYLHRADFPEGRLNCCAGAFDDRLLSHNKSLLSDLISVPANFLVIQRAGAWGKSLIQSARVIQA
jgi:hypothetical protein